MDNNPVTACLTCGAELPAGAEAWCPACGAPLSADTGEWEISAASPLEEPAADAETRPNDSVWKPFFPAKPRLLNGLAARPRALAAVAVVCVVVLAGIATGAYFLAARGGAAQLYPVLVNGETGFIDQSGQIVIEPQRQGDWIFSSGFSERRARMFVGGKWGFIDLQGAYVIPLQYDAADDFSEGLAAVWQGPQVSYIDTNGNVAIEVPGMTEGARFSAGLAAFGAAAGLSGPRYGYIDKRGNVVITPRFVAVGEFSEGLAAVEVMGEGNAGSLWGYIDKTGAWVIEPEFTSAGPFSEGLAAARKSSQDFGYIEETGAWAIHPEPSGFLYAGSFSEGLACVEMMAGEFHDTPKFGFIDKAGKTVIEPAFDTPGYFSQGRAAMGVFGQEEGVASWGYIDKDGDWVVQPTYLKAGPFQPGGLAAVVRSGSAWMLPDPPDGYLGIAYHGPAMIDSGPPDIAYIDKLGKVVWAADAETTTVSATSTTESAINPTGLYPVYVDDDVGYIDARGVMVGDTQKYGYVESNGKVAIWPQFAAATDFSDGLAAVQQIDGQWGYIGKQGQWVIKPTFASAGAFADGLAPARRITYGGEGLDAWGYLDEAGAWVIEPRFVYAGSFSDGLAPVEPMEYSGRLSPIGFIDTRGTLVIQPRFAVVGAFSQGLAAAWVLDPQYKVAGPFSEEGLAMVVRAGEMRSGLPWETYPEERWAMLMSLSSYFDDRPLDMAYIDKTGKVIWEPLRLPGVYD